MLLHIDRALSLCQDREKSKGKSKNSKTQVRSKKFINTVPLLFTFAFSLLTFPYGQPI